MLKIKAFGQMFHAIIAQSNRTEGVFPENWNEFGQLLPISHVLHQNTFRLIMENRGLSIDQLKQTGYVDRSIQDIEIFDRGTLSDYLSATFTLGEFPLAASQVIVPQV